MTIAVDLSDDALQVIRRKAASLGITVNELVSEIVERGVKLVDIGDVSESSPVPNGNRTRPARLKLTAEESLRRMNDFDIRKDQFIASIRKSKG